MRYTDLTNDELELFVDYAKLLSMGIITANKFITFFNELQKQVEDRLNNASI